MPGPADLTQDQLLANLPRNQQGSPVIGGVTLVKKIGSGGMGSVYLGLQANSGRRVAVKILPFNLVQENPNLEKRFLIEARAAAAIDSPNVVRVFDAGVEKRTHFIVQEFVEGDTIGARIRKARSEDGTLAEELVLRLAIAGAKGLAAAHAKRIVHRDVKPENFLIPKGDPDGTKLADLGLAKPEDGSKTFGTTAHVAMGTPGYMAPEQAESATDAGPPADVFAMGATIYAMLTGEPPFGGASLMAVLRATASGKHAPLPETVSPALRAVVDRCLSVNPADRFQGGSELLEALERVRQNPREAKDAPPRPAPTGSKSLVLEAEPVPAWHAGWLVGGAFAILLLILGTWAWAHNGRTHSKQAQPTASVHDDELKTLLDQAERLEGEGRLDDALASVARAAAIAPDDGRIRLIRERVAARQDAQKAAAEKLETWKTFVVSAEAARAAAEAQDTTEAWTKALAAEDELASHAPGEVEAQIARERRAAVVQRREWTIARSLRAGNLAEAIRIAQEAVKNGPPNPALDEWIRVAVADESTARHLAGRKKKFDELAKFAGDEPDPSKALLLWQEAAECADGPEDQARAATERAALAGRIAGADKEKEWDVVLAGIAKALDEKRLDEAEGRLKSAETLHPGDPKVAELVKRLEMLRAEGAYASAMAEARDAEKASDKAKAHVAYARALLAKPGDADAQAGFDATNGVFALTVIEGDKRLEIRLGDAANIPMMFARIAPATFQMGIDKEQRKVTLTKPFAIGLTEVTQSQWLAVIHSLPSKGRGPRFPVTDVGWWDAQRFVEALNERLEGWTAALPTEAQWEYACRGGSKDDYAFGDDAKDLGAYGWVKGNSEGVVHEVAQRKANAFGIFDMHGNVEEWCYDGEGPLDRKEARDPVGALLTNHRVMRGGSVTTPDAENRCGFRRGLDSWYADGTAGFRVILVEGKTWNPHVERRRVELPRKLFADFVRVRAGEFTMGVKDPNNTDMVQHTVKLTRDYWVQTTEVTQAQWEAVTGKPRTWANPGMDNPAEKVSWDESDAFAKEFSKRTGQLAALPTEAQWEMACRAETRWEWLNGDDSKGLKEIAWFRDNALKSQPVGTRRPNLWGLYDTTGNVDEWCRDWFEPKKPELETDPEGPATGQIKMIRGGNWSISPTALRPGFRGRLAPNAHEATVGVRLVLLK